MLPNFLVIGAMKAGTSSLHRYLRAHPQVFMSRRKETNFFTLADPDAQQWEEYASLFADAGTARAVGESSPNYTKYPREPDVPARIHAALPDVRLVYLVREPFARIRSHYLHGLARRRVRPGGIDRLLDRSDHLIDVTRYALQIERYLEHFDRSQLLVVQTERLRTARARTLARICAFVGVDPAPDSDVLQQEFNTSEQRLAQRASDDGHEAPGDVARRWMAEAVFSERSRRRVLDALRPDVARLYEYVDGDFDGWGIAEPERVVPSATPASTGREGG